LSFRYDISVIIVSYNCSDALKECLNSMAFQNCVTFEIVVVDNASGDDSAAYLKNQHYKKILSSRNLGFAAAVNLAVGQAEGLYLLILNPDTSLSPDALHGLFEFAECNPNAGIVSAMLISPEGGIQLSARTLPRRRDFILGRGSPLFKLGLTGEKEAGYIFPSDEQPLQVQSVSATALLIKHEIFKNIGGFDPRFFMYLEDVDLCRRISEKGLEIWILPSVKIKHSWRKSSRTRPYFASYQHHLSVLKYFNKYYPGQIFNNLLLLIFLVVGYAVSSIITFLKKGRREP
jgi:GT2 family glycosyltransferase